MDTINESDEWGMTMRKNATLECIRPVSYDGTAGKNEILVLLEAVIEIINKGFENMNKRLKLME